MPVYTLGPDGWPVRSDGRRATYWEFRRDLVYYHSLANIVRIVGHEATSLIDIGSAGCKYMEWFDWIPDRASLDVQYPVRAQGIRAIKADFITWKPDKTYDLVTCSQVLEHISDAAPFARKLLEIGRQVLVSVPHNWPAGSVPGHIHDPVDQLKVDAWFGRKPDYAMTVREPFGEERLFCCYNVAITTLHLSNADIMARLLSHPIDRSPERDS